MLGRKRRKGFWWYSWILVLLAIGGAVGGYFYGDKLWQEGPKEYRSTAILQADLRRPFLRGKESSETPGVRHENHSLAKRELEGLNTLRPVMRELNLTNRWTLNDSEALKKLSTSVDVEVAADDVVTLTIVRDSAAEAAEIANATAAQTIKSLALLDERTRVKAMDILDKALMKAREPIARAVETVAVAFTANEIPIVPNENTDLTPYMEITAVLEAKVDLDAAKEVFADIRTKQITERRYWNKPVLETKIKQEALPPGSFSGPDKAPIQKEYTLYGLTAGLALGLMLMFILWKLFSPKRS